LIRRNSFHKESITFDKHLAWFKEKLASSNTRIWILELNQAPVAQVRYESGGKDTAQINFSVASGYRGRGIGTDSLVLTAGLACKELGVKRLKGVVFSSNAASVKTFSKAGFKFIDETWISGNLCYLFELKCF
jgi:RimJ/RimL family protein N-acetyltransferase